MDKRYWLGLVAASAMAPLFAAPTSASPLAFSALDDQSLAELRGRYINAGEVLHFGVQLASVWTRPDGSRVGGAIALDVGPDRQATVTRYQLNNTAGNAASVGATNASPVDVKGVSQVNQVAGSGNVASNLAQIHLAEGDVKIAPSAAEGWQIVPTLVSDTGEALTLSVSGGLAGVASQSIGGGKLSQASQIKGSGMSVSNAMQIIVGLKPGAIGRGNGDNWIPSLTQGLR
ncbi:hypothetical protein [Jeongeupia chitinilytica]|uniref:Fap system outer membrane protein n=1 Tax=Jeongeupia chitinilytica TaxID=1041641 RepID=A0ABQ3H386_9NEIS|nr:hypothetical protein [Jeongeupia chitinilytica]GHD66423.1 hypothetical protein GCM10007350_28620 [Jeongeupia chitinilytica]